MNKEVLREYLSSPSPRIVSFIKKDGTKRIMHCTLNRDLIPNEYHTYGYSKEYDHLLTVFDLEIQEWRNINLSGKVEILA